MPTNPTDAFIWSFLPNWRSGFSVTREYRTDVFTSRSRRESRRALRSTPRRSYSYNAIVDGSELVEVNGLLASAQNKPFVMPDWSRRAALLATSAAASSTLTFAALPAWIVTGRALFLFDGKARPTTVFVQSIIGNSVTLTDPLADTWLAGTTVLPGSVGALTADLRANVPTNRVANFSVSFEVEPTSEPAEVPAAAPVTFNGREIFLLQPNWASGLDLTFNWPRERVDFNRGAVADFRPFDFASQVRRASFAAATANEARSIEDFITRMKGQRGEFYMPSGIADLTPNAALSAGASTIRVAGTHTDTHYSDSKVHKAICILLRDGTRLYRAVSGISLSGAHSLLTLTTPWLSTVQVADIRMVSWMQAWRMASDAQTVDWLTDQVAQCDMNLRTIEDLPAETA